MNILSRIQTPPMEYRPMNYWGWLENITPEETRRQVREMHEAGLGGYVMHARGGLTIPYMGGQWIDSAKAMIETGEALGMVSIVDDEHGWPSGFGAGHVNGKGRDYWVKWLRCRELPAREITVTPETLGVFRVAGGCAMPVPLDTLAGSDETFAHIQYEMDRFYVDNMDPKVVQAFIDYSYEGYRKEVGESFGKGLFGIFSDEPQLARYATPWSLILPEEFRQRFGYSLVDCLPALFYEIEGHERVRYHFWALVSELFTDSYARQINEWCDRNSIAFTGHTTLEESFYYQLQCSGNTLPFYEHMTIPGIDFLCRTKVNNLLCKQLSSVTEQLGKPRALSEMYGCAGWNVSFEEMKWIGEGHFVLGINLMLQHLGLYSLRGSRKREYPASLFYQQPWWKDFKPFNDYFARLSQLLTESAPLTDTLVIHPIKSAWITYNGNDSRATDALEASFTALTDGLLALNVDFHYGDETLLARHGRMRDGRLALGKCGYTTVILPPCLTLDRATAALLLEFARENPGRLISAGAFPSLVEGAPSAELEALRRAAVPAGTSAAELEAVLPALVNRRIRVERLDGKPNQWVYTMVRDLGGQTLYYVVNTAKDEGCDIRLIASEGLVQIDLETCAKIPVDPGRIHLDGCQSLVLAGSGDAPAVSPCAPPYAVVSTQTIAGPWAVCRQDLNSLTLDTCDYALEDGVWQGPIPVIELQQRLMKRAQNNPVTMKFTFVSVFVPEGPLYLVLEDPDASEIGLNGEPVGSEDCGWWIDRSFRKIDITGRVRRGENQITLRRMFACSDHTYRIKNDPTVHEAEANRVTVETELESVYLLGSFAVEPGESSRTERRALWATVPFVLAPLKAAVQPGDLTAQGYPFFAGEIVLENRFTLPALSNNDRIELSFSRPDAVLSEVHINGQLAKTFLWSPYRSDITTLCREGDNTIAFRLVGSCRNLLGPHHNTGGELYAVGPHAYRKHGKDWSDRNNLVQFGLDEDVSISINRSCYSQGTEGSAERQIVGG